MVKVGDKVMIIKKPPEDRQYGPSFVPDMDEYCGKVGKIVRIICDDEDSGLWFNVDIDARNYTWCEDFVVLLKQKSE